MEKKELYEKLNGVLRGIPNKYSEVVHLIEMYENELESPRPTEEEELKQIYNNLKRSTYSKDNRYNENGEDLWGDEYASSDKYHAEIYNEGLRDMINEVREQLSLAREEGKQEVRDEMTEEARAYNFIPSKKD